jgi:hypothetical protein
MRIPNVDLYLETEVGGKKVHDKNTSGPLTLRIYIPAQSEQLLVTILHI